MRVLLYGEGDRIGSGAWCYRQTLAELGHAVTVYSDSARLECYHGSFAWRVFRRLRRGIAEFHRARHVRGLMRTAGEAGFELVVVLKGLLLDRWTVELLKLRSRWVVNVNHDDFFSLNPNNRSRLQFNAIPAYDFIFTTRVANVEEVRPYNERVEFFPFAYYPAIHRPLEVSDDERRMWGHDLVFVGTWERERCQSLESLVTRLCARYGIFGNQWTQIGRSSPLRPYLGSELIGDDLAKAIGCSKIALGFLRKENRDTYTQRTFEIPACGGVLLAERTTQQMAWFKAGTEAEFFDATSNDELCAKAAALLNDAARREAMRQKGRAALLRQRHTYKDRLERLVALYLQYARR